MRRLVFQLLFWIALVFALVMAVLPHPPQLPGDPNDKVQHILAFTVLTGLALPAFPRLPVLYIGISLAVFGALIEAVQAIPALHRDSSALDWVADCGAVLVVLLIGGPTRRRLLRRDSSTHLA